MTEAEFRTYIETWAVNPDPEKIAEILIGGKLSPCPMCKTPRCERSDYVRCARCGVNWLQGEDLSKDPRAERWRETIAKARAAAKG